MGLGHVVNDRQLHLERALAGLVAAEAVTDERTGLDRGADLGQQPDRAVDVVARKTRTEHGSEREPRIRHDVDTQAGAPHLDVEATPSDVGEHERQHAHIPGPVEFGNDARSDGDDAMRCAVVGRAGLCLSRAGVHGGDTAGENGQKKLVHG